MKINTVVASAALVGVLVLLSFAFIASADADVGDPHMDVGTEVKFYSGSGYTTHGPSSDTSVYNDDSKVTMTLTVLTKPSGPNQGWDSTGTLSITGIEFSESSDLIYFPSYILDKDGNDITIYKVVSIDLGVVDEIDSRTISVVLPQALKDVPFSKSVTKITEGSYTDTKGTLVRYAIDETAPFYYNGFACYAAYANNDKSPDMRMCELGHVISTTPAGASYDTKMVNWSKNDMVSCDSWVCGSFPDMIAAVLTCELTFVGSNVSYSEDSVTCAAGSVVSIDGLSLTVNGVTVTAEPKKESMTFERWSVEDGQKITADTEIEAIFEGGSSGSDSYVYWYTGAIFLIIVLIVLAVAHVKAHKG